MKRLHIINLDCLAGTEQMLIQFINNTDGNDEDKIININNKWSNQLTDYIPREIVKFPYRIIEKLNIKYPPFMRKYILRYLLEKERADLIIVWNLIPSLDKKPSYGKIIYYDHGNSWLFNKNSKTIKFFSMVDGCISASYASQRMLQLKLQLQCPIETVTNSIPVPKKLKIQKKSLGTEITLGTASRLESGKAIGVSILTTKELNHRGINTKLYIAGSGSQEEKLKKLVKTLGLGDKVIFLGFQNDLSEFYQLIDFYISSPITEAFGLSCMEALYNSIPVIFPMIDGQPEVITSGYSGLGYIPTMSFDEYHNLTDMEISYDGDGYDPIHDRLVKPKVPHYLDYANGIEDIVANNKYDEYRKNAKAFTQKKYDFFSFNRKLNEKMNNFILNINNSK